MAFIPYSINDINPEDVGKPKTSGQSSIISGNNSSIVPQEREKTSGSFTNLQSYLNANSDQASQMGTRVAGKIDEKATEATSKLQGLSDKFNQQVNSNRVVADDDLINRAATDSVNFIKNNEDVTRFNQMRD
ncbi:MAG: hypothetical protein E6R13_01595 [Spirochaetes bacterium]|nr:MAG: hypothetical protein E6R13_01595 [Spirochaetota bacterium]